MRYRHANNRTIAKLGPFKYRRVDRMSILNGPFGIVYRRVDRHFVLQVAGRTVFKWPLSLELA